MSDEVKQLWDDDRINRLIRDILTEQPNHTPRGLARRTAYTVRDDLQAAIAAEKAKVAELERAVVWAPVEDGSHDAQHFNHTITIDRDYLKLSVPGLDGGPHDEVEVGLPEGWALCRRITQEGVDDARNNYND